MKLLVIVVTYNGIQWVERCFGGIFNSSIIPDVYVIDNGSTDGTQQYINCKFPQIMFHQSDQNLGFGRANNLGLQFALDNDYEYVYLLNQDAWVMPDTFERIIEVSKNYPEFGILSPFQMEANMEHLDLNFKKNVCAWKSSPDLLDDLYLGKRKDVIPVLNVMAAHWLITRDCLEKVGGFSPTFRHYGEDDNYIDRVFYWGFKVGIVPSLKVVHDRENRVLSLPKLMYLNYVGDLRILSNPIMHKRKWLKVSYRLFTESLKKGRISPIRYWFTMVKNSAAIIKNRVETITKQSAFLKK